MRKFRPTAAAAALSSVSVLVLVLAGAARAEGFAVGELSVESAGRANAGSAADAGAGMLWWNPAAIARSGRQLTLGAVWRDDSGDFTDDGTAVTLPVPPAGLTVPVGGRAQVSDASQDVLLPSGAVALPIGERLALGLSVTRPFQLETDFGSGSWTRYDTVRSKIAATDLQLGAALRVSDWLDLGLAADAQKVDAYMDQAYPNLAPGAPDALSRLTADDWAWGWTAGAQAHLHDVTFGVSYRSAIEHQMDGQIALSGLVAPLDGANFQAPAQASFTLPWTLTAAARWAATPALTLGLQVVRAGWSKYDAIEVAFAGQSVSVPQHFQDVTSMSLGADYALDEVWTVRAGVGFQPTPTPDVLREPGVFDADRRVYAVGASARLSPAVRVHGALSYADYSSAPLVDTDVFYAGTPAMTVVQERGRFDGRSLTAGLSLDWRF